MTIERYPTAADKAAYSYDPAPNLYALAADPRCLFGWGPPEHGCRHYFGHGCSRAYGHAGDCRDDPHDAACSRARRPKDWDSAGRAEANR